MNQHPNEIMSDQTPPSTSRRQFLKASTTAALGSVFAANLSFPEKTFAANSDTLKVGLIGCGGRGTGAANQALNADKNVVLTAMADVFENQLQGSLRTLKGEVGDRVKVEPDHCLVGLDAYLKALGTVRNWHRLFREVTAAATSATSRRR